MKVYLKLMVTVFIVVMALCCSFAFANENYNDITNHWANSEITKWSDLEILKGYESKFRPNDYMTRGELAVVLDRIMKYQVEAENTFTDLDSNFYTSAMLKANASKIILGDGITIRPTDNITREEATVMLARALGIEENSGNDTKFIDAQDISSWAQSLVFGMEAKGYVQGTNNKFLPKANITRAEVVKILDNSITKIYNSEGTYSENITGLVIINTPNVTLNKMVVTGNVIISEGVGDKEAYFNDVEVTGKLIVRGGGENSIYFKGITDIGDLIVSKMDKTPVRINVGNRAHIDLVDVCGGNVSLTGTFSNVSISSTSASLIQLSGANIQQLSADTNNTILIDDKSRVTSFKSKSSSNITVNGIIDKLDIDKPLFTGKVKIDIGSKGIIKNLTLNINIDLVNKGKIDMLRAKADNIVVQGNKPLKITIDSSVKVKPTDEGGIIITSTINTSGGGVSKISLADASIEIAGTHIYTGSAIVPEEAVNIGELVLVKDTDYTVSATNNINAGEAILAITGIGKYSGTATETFTIEPKSLESANITIDGTYTYTGSAIVPEAVVKMGETTLVKDRDYTVSATNNTNAGTATLTITGIGNYAGTAEKAFTIEPKRLQSTNIEMANTYTYTGSSIVPSVVVKIGETILEENTDYIVRLPISTINVGTVMLGIEGKGNYTGCPTKEFRIVHKSINNANIEIKGTYTYTGSEIVPKDEDVIVTLGGTTLFKDTAYTVALTNNINAGTATLTITGKGNYAGTKEKTFTIGKKPLGAATIRIDGTYTYTGSPIVPEAVVTLDETSLVKDRDYTVSVTNNINASNGVFYQIYAKGNYEGATYEGFVIGKKPITITDAAIGYNDGTNEATVESVTLDGLVGEEQLVKGTDYTLAGVFNSADILTANKVTVTLTLSDTTKANNYSVSDTLDVESKMKVDVASEIETKTNALVSEFYNKPAGTTLSPSDEQYYIEVGSISNTPDKIRVGNESFNVVGLDFNQSELISVSMGNNNFINESAWKIIGEKLLIAIPVLALEASPSGIVNIDIEDNKSVDLEVKVYASETGHLSLTSVCALGSVPEGYINTVEVINNKVTQNINHGRGYLGLLLNDGTSDIIDSRKVFTKKRYKDAPDHITSVNYGVTETGEIPNVTTAFYAAGYKNGPFAVDQVRNIYIDYSIAVIGKGAIDVELEIHRTTLESIAPDVSADLTPKLSTLFGLYNKPKGTTLSPSDSDYYIKVANALGSIPSAIKIGDEVFEKADGDVKYSVSTKVSMGNNNFINYPVWKLDGNNNLLIAVPVLALESSPSGIVPIDIGNNDSIELNVTAYSSSANRLSIDGVLGLDTQKGYINDAVFSDGTIEYTTANGKGYLGIRLKDGETNILDGTKKVLTKKVYKGGESIVGVSYGVTLTENPSTNVTLGFYAAGYKAGPFTRADQDALSYNNMDYKVFMEGVGVVNVPININMVPCVDVASSLQAMNNNLITNYYNKTEGTVVQPFNQPTNSDYYIEVVDGLTGVPNTIVIGNTEFQKAGENESVSIKVSMGNNNFIEQPAWKIIDGKLLIAAPILALESSPNGTVEIRTSVGGSVELVVIAGANTTKTVSLVSACGLGIPEGYTNTVEVINNKVTQYINHGEGYLGLLLNDGTSNITSIIDVFTRKVYKDASGHITSVGYGVTKTEEIANATVAFYAAGYKPGPFTAAEQEVRYMDYTIAVPNAGAITLELEIHKTVK